MKSILIAEGDEQVGHMFADVFASHAWNVITFTDGLSAGEELRRSAHYDAVLVSYRLPQADGVAFVRGIRALQHRKGVPIVMVTGTVRIGVAVEALAAGADEVLYKPFAVGIVVGTVNKWLERRRHSP